MKARNRILASLILISAFPATALAQSQERPQQQYVCTAEQAFGPLLGRLLPVTISREQAPLFGLDPAECQTPVGEF